MSEFLSPTELCAMLGTELADIEHLDRSGRLPEAIELAGRYAYIRREIEAWLADGCPVTDPAKAAEAAARDEAETQQLFATFDRLVQRDAERRAARQAGAN